MPPAVFEEVEQVRAPHIFMLSILLNAFPDSFGITFFARRRFFLGAAAGCSIEAFRAARALRFFFGAAFASPELSALEPFVFFQLAEALFRLSLKLVEPAAWTFFTCCNQVVML